MVELKSKYLKRKFVISQFPASVAKAANCISWKSYKPIFLDQLNANHFLFKAADYKIPQERYS
ncbi:hypothetical protein ASG14_15245 [Pedobacter sp. Leaf194]|nr:hypothetical protein ASG14_15245 [Pedobacter sp. Leaf194]